MKSDILPFRYLFAASMAAASLLVAGCASNPRPQVDPIFQAGPGGQYECYYQNDDRNVAVKGATSKAGQAVLGAAAGGVVGNQFGSGSGRDIATGLGALAGAGAGAWNARRMENNRLNDCLQRSNGYQNTAPAGNGNMSPSGFRSSF